MRFRFAEFEIDTESFTLHRGGEPVHVEPLVFDLLRVLAENPGRLFTREDLIDRVWGGRFVSDATVASCIKTARRVLGDTGSAQTYIRTVRARGIQFLASVTAEAGPSVLMTPTPGVVSVPDAEHGASASDRPRIAVLPFEPLAAPHHVVLGDAVAQEVILELSRLHWLSVIARGSSFRFRGRAVDPAEASAVLGVEYLLTGTIDVDPPRAVLVVELLHMPRHEVIWAERFDTALDVLMHMRAIIAAQIVGLLEPRLQQHEALRAARLPTDRLDAWSAYHRGLWHMFRFNREDNARATGFFEQALRLDPVFARAHAGLSFTHFQNVFLGFSADGPAERRLVQAHAEQSLALDPLDPFANLTVGRAHWLASDLEAALPWMERSIALSPNSAFALYNSALVGTLLGEGAANERKVARAIDFSPIDPLNYAMLATRAMSHAVRGEFAEAVAWVERAVHAPSAHVQIYALAAIFHDLTGGSEKAAVYAAHIRAIQPGYERADFLASFPFRDAKLRNMFARALQRLGL